MENKADFLKETEFCDFSNVNIKKLADQIVRDCKTDRDFAVSTFYWVRDNILYSVGNWQKKASETLKNKQGTCTNKANLFVALLRCKNIPAGYGVMKVYGKRYLGPIAIPIFRQFISEESTHVYPLVFLDNKWIKCDPSDDKEFSENTSYFNPGSKLVNWDGYNDARLNLDEKDIITDNNVVDSIDPWMFKRSKGFKKIVFRIANDYIDFARKNKKRVSGSEELFIMFKEYIKRRNIFKFLLIEITEFFVK